MLTISWRGRIAGEGSDVARLLRRWRADLSSPKSYRDPLLPSGIVFNPYELCRICRQPEARNASGVSRPPRIALQLCNGSCCAQSKTWMDITVHSARRSKMYRFLGSLAL